jgi:hypothetical protein
MQSSYLTANGGLLLPSQLIGFERSGCCAIAAVQIVVRARYAAVTHDGVYENANKLTAL